MMEPSKQERDDVWSVRLWCRAAHVDDPDALKAFNSGKGVFDVHPQGLKLEQFLAAHSLEKFARRTENGELPSIRALVNHGPVYIAWKKQTDS